MKKFIGLTLACVLLVCFGLSCEKIDTSREAVSPVVSSVSEIPASYGSLVSVTVMQEYPGWFQLWFQDNAGTVRMVRIQALKNLMANEVKTYPRSQSAGEATRTEEEVTTDEG